METSLNQVTLIGTVGVEPTFREMGANKIPFLRLSVATSKPQVGESSDSSPTVTWHVVNVYGKLAVESNELIKKDTLVSIVGELENRSFENNGKHYHISEVKASQVIVLSNKKYSMGSPDFPLAGMNPNKDPDSLVNSRDTAVF